MTVNESAHRTGSGGDRDPVGGEEIVELALLLSRDQFSALEDLAGAKRITVALLLRQAIQGYLVRESGADPEVEGRPGSTPVR
ncbi:MAG: hypothetical protein J0I06_00175 [Planctomycetes bacterium]|nr:hypothetical protein [Planctomycetota bacterium]